MERRSVAVGVGAAVVGAGVAAAEAGLVGQSALGNPVWLLLGAFVIGYWAVFIHWARA